jgi:malate synthase
MRAVAEEVLGLQPVRAPDAVGAVGFDRPAGATQPVPDETDASATTPALITRAGFVGLIDSCVRHLAAWLGGGEPERVPAEALASAEASRVQLWHWLHRSGTVLDDGTPIDFALFDSAIQRVGERLPRRGLPGQGNVLQAACLLAELTHAHTLAESVAASAPARGC